MQVYLRLLADVVGWVIPAFCSKLCKPEFRCIDQFTEQKAFFYIAYHASLTVTQSLQCLTRGSSIPRKGKYFCSLRPMYLLADPRNLLSNRCRWVKWSKHDANQVSLVSKFDKIWGFNTADTTLLLSWVIFIFLILKFPPCSERCILSFGWFPGVWILCADVSEHTVPSSYVVCAHTTYEDGTDSVPKRRHIKFRRRGIIPIKNTPIFTFF